MYLNNRHCQGSGLVNQNPKQNKKPVTISGGINIYENGPPLSKIDFRIPAINYTLDCARRSRVHPNARKQAAFFNIFAEANESIKEKRKLKNSVTEAKKFFNMQ